MKLALTSSKYLISSLLVYKNLDKKDISCETINQSNVTSSERVAVCFLQTLKNDSSQTTSNTFGHVSLKQSSYDSKVDVLLNIFNASPNSLYTLQAHTFGDIVNQGQHLGDNFLGKSSFDENDKSILNFKTNYFGEGIKSNKLSTISLYGENSLIGRGLAVYEKKDDENSKKTISKISCAGVVGYGEQFKGFF